MEKSAINLRDLLQSGLRFSESGISGLNKFGYYWGITGVLILLISAIVRLSYRVIEMLSFPLTAIHWMSLIAFTLYMAYAEGYKGFHLNFSPRVIARAGFFCERHNENSLRHILFAPLFCMGYFHATRKRKITALALTSLIIILVLIVSRLPQPWRGIIDAGVVFGLLLGVCSILYFWISSLQQGWRSPVSPDFPA